MTAKVEFDEIAAAAADRPFAYLITVGGAEVARPHLLAVTTSFDGDGTITISNVGRHTSANVNAGGLATLVWPPAESTGYSLIVDGTAAMVDDTTVAVVATKALLHRPALDADGQRAGSDCQPVTPATD